MTIEDTIWLLAHSTHPEDRREWAVLYWKAQGLKHTEIADKFHYSEQWVQRYMTRAYERFGVPKKLDKYQKLKILEETVFPKIREFIAGNPDTLKELPPPPVEEPEDVEDTSPNQVIPRPPTPVIEVRPSKTPTPVRLLRYVIFGIVACGAIGGIAYYAYRLGVGNNPTPVPTQAGTIIAPQNTVALTGIPSVQVIPPSSAPALTTDTPQPAPTDTPFPTKTPFAPPADGILFQDSFEGNMSPEWHPAFGNWIIADNRLTVLVDQSNSYKWIRLEKPEWKNYILSVKVIIPFQGSGAQQYLALSVRGGGIGAEINTFSNVFFVKLGNNHFDDQPYAGKNQDSGLESGSLLEIEAVNDTYTIRINGTQVQTVTISGLPQNGGIGLGTECGYELGCPAFDDVKVTYLP